MCEEFLQGRLVLHCAHFPAARAAELYARLERETRWLQVTYDNAGRSVKMPRLTANYGERSYDYGGCTCGVDGSATMTPLALLALLAIRRRRGQADSSARPRRW